MFHPVLKILEKTHSVYAEILWNCVLNPHYVLLFGFLLGNATTVSHKAFSHINHHAKYSSQTLSISLRYRISIESIYADFTFQRSTTIWWFFKVFSGVDASIGGPERGASLVLLWPHLNSLSNRRIVVLEKGDVR